MPTTATTTNTPHPMEIQLQNLILKRVEKELRKMPNKSHNISFSMRLLAFQLKEYLDHMQVVFPPKEIEEIKEYLILQFQALLGVLISMVQAYPNAEYYKSFNTIEDELTKWSQKNQFKRAEWK